jgi:hypothetical protein
VRDQRTFWQIYQRLKYERGWRWYAPIKVNFSPLDDFRQRAFLDPMLAFRWQSPNRGRSSDLSVQADVPRLAYEH